MIIYNSKDWLKALAHFHTSYTIRLLLRRILMVGAYGAVITIIDLHFIDFKMHIDGNFFSLLGILLSLLLVFRTNTAYDRYWEGRKQWGALVNHSRNLAVMLDALIPDDDLTNRHFFARTIANFAMVLKGHLRTGVTFEELDETEDCHVEALKRYEHKPSRLSAILLRRIEEMHRLRLISGEDLLNLKPHHQALLDITGACERIQKTPIPFSYSFFIKLLITVYLLIFPFIISETYQYLAIPALMLAAYALMGVEMIADEIEEPFGLDCNDLPLGLMSRTIRRNVHEILNVPLATTSPAEKEVEYMKVH
ncbi:MAG: bestrophin family ion channel [Bacteroidota bacterium]